MSAPPVWSERHQYIIRNGKVPCDWRSYAAANPHDPANWIDRVTALAKAAEGGPNYGIGFVFTDDDDLWFLDIDHALHDRVWSDVATQLCTTLAGAYVEVSQSGEGLHIIGRGTLPPHATRNGALGLELYSRARYCALTGIHATGSMEADLTPAITTIASQYFPPAVGAIALPADWTDGPCEGWSGPADDDDLIRMACNATSAAAAFGDSLTFKQVWEADDESLGKAFPDAGAASRVFDASRVDMSLARRLAWWTGRDCARIERIMRRSALVREKWDREDYLRRTILRACAQCKDVRSDRRNEASMAGLNPEGAYQTTKMPTPLSMSTFGIDEHLRAPAASRVNLVRATNIEAEAISWLWCGYLASGKLHILAGSPGTGKTTLAVAMAATITRAGQWPDGTASAGGSVLMWSGEDGLADSLKPRFMANGGEPDRMYFVHSVAEGESARPFDPATDIPEMVVAARAIPDLRLMIVDPLVSAVAGDSHKNAEVRRSLQPLVDLGRELGVAILGITHFTKGTQGRDPTERVTGSLAFAAFARLVMCTAKPAEEGRKRRLVRAKATPKIY